MLYDPRFILFLMRVSKTPKFAVFPLKLGQTFQPCQFFS
jgi:hypothetical protein